MALLHRMQNGILSSVGQRYPVLKVKRRWEGREEERGGEGKGERERWKEERKKKRKNKETRWGRKVGKRNSG
jgi:hypothetical protein